MSKENQPRRLTAEDVLQRHMDDNLPAFAEIDLREVNQVGLFGEFGHTPLHQAVTMGRLEAVGLLLKHGASLSPRNEWGNTIFDSAGFGNCAEILKLLEAAAATGRE